MPEDKTVWCQVAKVGDIEQDDLIDVEIDGNSYAIYWIDGGYFATDGKCSHECAPLVDGLVDGDVIECPKHNARFHIPTGKALRRPAKTDLQVYPVKVEGDRICIGFRQDA